MPTAQAKHQLFTACQAWLCVQSYASTSTLRRGLGRGSNGDQAARLLR